MTRLHFTAAERRQLHQLMSSYCGREKPHHWLCRGFVGYRHAGVARPICICPCHNPRPAPPDPQ